MDVHLFLLGALVIATMKEGTMVYILEDEAVGPQVRRFHFHSEEEEGTYPLEDEAVARGVH